MDQWTKFLQHALTTRLDPADFTAFVQILASKQPLPPRKVADLFLRPQGDDDFAPDARLLRYMGILLDLSLLDLADLLRSLGQYSSFQAVATDGAADKEKKGRRWKSSHATEEILFYRVAKSITDGKRPKNAVQALDLVKTLTGWSKLIMSAAAAEELMHSLVRAGTVRIESAGVEGVKMAFATVLLAVSESAVCISALGGSGAKGRRISRTLEKSFGWAELRLCLSYFYISCCGCLRMYSATVLGLISSQCNLEIRNPFNEALASFIPSLVQTSTPMAQRLDIFRNQILAIRESGPRRQQDATAEIDQIIDSIGADNIHVADGPVVNSRAGLYVYINAMVCIVVIWS
jgi:mediator of RNA polymerase II transcription subunit 5